MRFRRTAGSEVFPEYSRAIGTSCGADAAITGLCASADARAAHCQFEPNDRRNNSALAESNWRADRNEIRAGARLTNDARRPIANGAGADELVFQRARRHAEWWAITDRDAQRRAG